MGQRTRKRLGVREQLLGWMDAPVSVLPVSSRTQGDTLRIAGDSLFIRSKHCELNVSSEALGAAFLLPAASVGRRISGHLADPQWLAGMTKILGVAREWWGWRAGYPRFQPSPPSAKVGGVGLAFSLGVDSFYSCFFAEPRPDLLILAAGFDVPLESKEVLDAMCRSVAEVAEATDAQWALIETDLRRHRLFRRASWECVHGGAVAMLGHLISSRCGSFVISSSFEQGKLGPWGSHPDLDPLWSSSTLRIQHFGGDVSRLEKLRRLIRHPVARKYVQRHLRVCWVAPNESGNCGKCRKCTLLRVSLAVCEPGFQLETMPNNVNLLDAVKSMAPCPGGLVLNFWRELQGGDDPQLDEAIRDLVSRSEGGYEFETRYRNYSASLAFAERRDPLLP